MTKKNMDFLPIIGIEVHVELKTKSKMFCSCPAWHFQVKPNTHTCPVCLGLPGALPVPNKKAIEWCILIGLALESEIAKESKFDRKNYFYPDLAKGYQISQYDKPFCKNGKMEFKRFKSLKFKKVRINRVHMEEDTGKLVHRGGSSLIDFNRSGVPLVEIVSEPDIHSAEQAVVYLKKIQQIIRYLGVSDCDMEKGSMRCEINISLNKTKKLPNYRVEIKNINSFKFVKKVIEYEIQRQTKVLKSGKTPLQETRGYDEKKETTYVQRNKEEAHDYRYFPEPDIPPISIQGSVFSIQDLPELPNAKIQRFIKTYNLSEYNARILTQTRELAEYFDTAAKIDKDPKQIAKIIVNKRINIKKFTPQQLVKHLQKQKTDKVSDKSQIEKIIIKVLKENKKAVKDYKKGKQETIGFLIGQVMRETKGKAEVQLVKKILVEKL